MTAGTPLLIDHIEAKPGTGTPRIKGKGVSVSLVAYLAKDPEWTIERICEDFGLTPGEVYAALSYYADHQVEIDQAMQDAEKRLDERFAENPELDSVRQRLLKRRSAKT